MIATDKLIGELRGLAQKATKGPWTLVVGSKGELYIRTDDDVDTICRESPRDEDAEFLAACEPEAILAILDTISSLNEETRLLSVENGLLLSNAAAKGEEPDLLLAEWHNERRRADRAEEAFAICIAQIGTLREALEPFAAFAENVDEEGWMSNIHRGSISTWFGPSDFRRAARALSDTGETG